MFASLTAGSSFADRFRVVKLLSEGEVGPLLVAEEFGNGARVALKVLHEDILGDRTLRERFEAEVKPGVENDHIVNVLDAGIDAASGCPWLAMELLEGEELRSKVQREGALPAREVVRILAAVGAAIQGEHDRGRAHAGLTHENVFLGKNRIKVRELGLARFMVEVFAREGELVGEPLWMAPEQLKAGAPATPAADVWAMGLLAFWMLTGRSYWKHGNEANAPLRAQLREIVVEPLETASQRAAAVAVGARLPAWFDAWFARCVTRMPVDRFASARVAIDELLRASSPVKALPKVPSLKVALPKAKLPPKPLLKAPIRPLVSPARERIHTTPGLGKVEVKPEIKEETKPEPKEEIKPEAKAEEKPEVTEEPEVISASVDPSPPEPTVPFEEPLVEPPAPVDEKLVLALVRERRVATLLIAALLAGAALAVVSRLATHEPAHLASLDRGFEKVAVAPPIPRPKEQPAAKLVLDPKQLPKDRSQLVMTPPLPGIDVYVDGERYGSAAETNVVPCGSVLVRLYTADGSWKSRIRAVWLRCQRLNTLSIEPMATYALAPRAPAAPRITKPKVEPKTTTRRRR